MTLPSTLCAPVSRSTAISPLASQARAIGGADGHDASPDTGPDTGPHTDIANGIAGAAATVCRDGAVCEATPIEFLDIAFTPADMDEALSALADRPASAPFAYVVTPNVDHVVRLLRRRSDLWPAYRGAWMTLCDSRILARLARAVGRELPVLTGSDLTLALFEQVIGSDDSIAILGGSEATVAAIRQRYGLNRVAHYNPPMGFINDPCATARAVRFLVETRARYAFLAVGSPQQEIVARRVAKARGATGIGLCVGASLEFLTGEQERAPAMMQQMSLEWLYRLGSNPQRLWRRYLIDGPQIFRIHQHWRRTVPQGQAPQGGVGGLAR